MNPYSVLGISPTATDAEIKTAYRNLAKKYHPDKYRGHDLEDLAGEKIKEINKAYDMIQEERASGRSTGSTGAGFGGASYSARGGSGRYADIRRAIQQGNLSQADAMLDAISNRNAEWHYLKGLVLLRKNWYDGARQHFATAAEMDPGNAEYQNAYRTVNNSASGYNQTYYNTRSGGGDSDCSICNICGGLLCADCCCECCGGDLISCC